MGSPTATEPKLYQYTPLPENRIRLLVLHPGRSTDPLVCEVIVHSLEDTEPYEALSYAWGSPEKVSKLLCDGGSSLIPITASLAAALERLRLDNDPRRIWADAVCINQLDILEKGNQISIMSQIYGLAERTVVWLGEGDNSTGLAMETLHGIAKHCLQAGNKDIQYTNELMTTDPRELVRGIIVKASPTALAPDDEEKWVALFKFFSASWWSRIWVIQEVSLGRSPLLYCGTHTIPWGTVLLSSIWADYHFSSISLLRDGPLSPQMQAPCQMHIGIAHCDALDPSSLVASARSFDATDARDKIFALLSFKPLKFHPMWCITADYSKTILEVYIQAVVACIMQSKRLRVMEQVYHADSEEIEMFVMPGRDLQKDGFPTWVPRWDIAEGAGTAALLGYTKGYETSKALRTAYEGDDDEYRKVHVRGLIPLRDGEEGIQVSMSTVNRDKLVEENQTEAARTEKRRDSIGSIAPVIILPKEPGERSMKIRGINIGVCQTGSIALHRSWWEFSENFKPVLLLLMQGMVMYNPEIMHDDEQKRRVWEELATVLVAGQSNALISASDRDQGVEVEGEAQSPGLSGARTKEMLTSWNVTLNLMEQVLEEKLEGDNLAGLPPSKDMDDAQKRIAELWSREAAQRTHQRRIFRTANGHLGNGPAAMRMNDVVVVPYGADVPFVLRPFGNQWQVVGACYLCGYMNGEAAEGYISRNLEMEMFELI